MFTRDSTPIGISQCSAGLSYGRHAGRLQHAHRNVLGIVCVGPRAGGQKDSTAPIARPRLLHRNEQQQPHPNANLRALKPHSYSPGKVQVTGMSADFSTSLSLWAFKKNLLRCQKCGSLPAHKRVRICLFCKREPRKMRLKGATNHQGKGCGRDPPVALPSASRRSPESSS